MASEPRTVLPIKASALPGVHTAEGCRKCSCEDGYLAQYIKVNGQISLRWVCDWCEDYATAGDLPRAMLGDFKIETLPLRVDHSQEDNLWPECEQCGAPAVTFHHWAPRSLFPDWPTGLGAYLCQRHHDEWHDVTRTHGLRYPHEMQDVS